MIALTTNPCDLDDWLCNEVYDRTGHEWPAAAADVLVARPAAILGLVIAGLVASWIAHRLIDRITKRAGQIGSMRSVRNSARADTLGSVLKSVTSVAIWGLVTIMIISELGYNVGPLIAGAGIIGIALGLGAQGVVKDFLYGMFMFLEDQIGVGDTVTIDGVTGTVEALNLRTTKLRSQDGVIWYIRNGDVAKVGNQSQA